MRHRGGIPIRVVCDESNNSADDVAAGIVRATISFPRAVLDSETRAAADALAAWAKPKTAKKRSAPKIRDDAFLALLDEVGEFLAKGEWEKAEPKHFVALYADLHFRCYGIEPGDMGPKERAFASKLAGDMLEKDFAGNRLEMSRFVAWVWTREKGREEWRRENGRAGGRVTWRSQFGRAVLTEYRLEEARKKARR